MSDSVTESSLNKVLFELNRTLDERDLDVLTLYLENKKQSGGGDILKIDKNGESSKRTLTVAYEETDAQERILAKKFFKFQNYFLRSSENGHKRNDLYALDTNKIILSNFEPNEEDLVVQMYAEYLLPDNSVIDVECMQMISNSFCITFQDKIDFERLNLRYNKKQKLRNRQIQLLNAFKTDTLIIGKKSGKIPEIDNVYNKLHENFPSTLKSDMKPFMFIEKTGKFIVCQFEDSNIELLAKIILKEKKFIFDQCLNFDLIKEKIFNEPKGEGQNNKEQNITGDKKSQNSTGNIKIAQKISPNSTGDEKAKLFGSDLAVQIDTSSILNIVFSKCKTILNDFKKDIQEKDAEFIVVTEKNGTRFNIECINENSDPIAWTKSINFLINNYEISRLKQKKISIPVNLRKNKELTDLKNHMNFHFKLPLSSLHYNVNQDSITTYGYTTNIKNFADNIHSKFCNLENNIKDRCKHKIDVRLDIHKYPLMIILGNGNGHFLKEFSNQIIKLEALVELIDPDAKNLKLICQMGKNKLTNEQVCLTWRQNIDNFIIRYFAKFRTDRIHKLPFKKSEIGSDKTKLSLQGYGFNEKIMMIKWLNDDSIDVTGLREDLNKIQNKLKIVNPEKINKSLVMENLESKANVLEFTEETFQISDLKWFQTKMLHERKYFQFVSEAYLNLSILVDTNLTWIRFKGQKKDIEDAKQLAFDILDKILGTEVEADLNMMVKMTKNDNELENIIKNEGLCCVVDFISNKDKFTIYGTTREEIGKCKFLLNEIKF